MIAVIVGLTIGLSSGILIFSHSNITTTFTSAQMIVSYKTVISTNTSVTTKLQDVFVVCISGLTHKADLQFIQNMSGAPISGMEVTLYKYSKEVLFRSANDSGVAEFPDLTPGNYTFHYTAGNGYLEPAPDKGSFAITCTDYSSTIVVSLKQNLQGY